jgi:anti-sigma regulatory factor (Ser/Thr protein kinase)
MASRRASNSGSEPMNDGRWLRQPPKAVGETAAVWTAEPASLAALSVLRRQLRSALAGRSRAPGAEADASDRLLLVVEELASNGLRHGQPPVRVVVVTLPSGWRVEVSDARVDESPEPAVDRDAADGGMGLFLVSRLSAAHGWVVRDGRKHVWARIDIADGSPADATEA